MIQELGISKRLFNFLIFLLIIDLSFAILFHFNQREKYDSLFTWIFQMTFPVWISISGGSILGIFLMLIPQKGDSLQQKLVRSMLLGTFALAAVFFIIYFYEILIIAFTNEPISGS